VRKKVLISDLTRMQGNKVCIAGYTGYPDSLECVRPMFVSGSVDEDWLCKGSEVVIRPFAEVELDFLERPDVTPPHTEDYIIDRHVMPNGIRLLSERKRLALLESLEDACVREIFGTEIRYGPGHYVKSGTGVRSLGTIRPSWFTVSCEPWNGKPDYRISFGDGKSTYRLKVTDLAFQYYINKEKEIKSHKQVAEETNRLMRSADHVFFRIGLARGWQRYPDRCYLQITGVYTFPDYLGGKCFAHFSE